ncbi:phosphotransferase [Paenibacillus sp. JNUCC31]|uniref:phosphotransferase family protein n=1 Tax=Paenibacillus sp. JNUCC-31 TaxID=2777983 RepID=UPI0017870121|nr:phosphotransferase [Paenibacillus sp. JNUCC-31]QOS81676.1 phosphotransferase [Paenibacillus sp. JNUCC-31]
MMDRNEHFTSLPSALYKLNDIEQVVSAQREFVPAGVAEANDAKCRRFHSEKLRRTRSMVDQGNAELHVSCWVTPQGMLNDRYVYKRERLYKGMNGRYVERFTAPGGESYIFKPLTHQGQHGRELWMAEHVLAHLPPIYPRLIASSVREATPDQSWIIYEDLGELVHDSREEIMLAAAVHMTEWHTLSVADWGELPCVGQKPPIRDMLDDLLVQKESAADLLTKLEITLSPSDWDNIAALIHTAEEELPRVLCHGDLHPGNMADVNGRLVIIDWEHAHLNTALWDMYHLVDLSHPLFPRTVMPELRERIIDVYLDGLERHSVQVDRVTFKRWYRAYAIVFSLWMLRLIDGDLRSADCVWPEEQLRNQWNETAATLGQCMNRLFGDFA